MMKMRISTPHYLGQMKGKASPFGFVLHPRTRTEQKLTKGKIVKIATLAKVVMGLRES